MKNNIKLLAICVSVPLIVGALSGIISRGGMEAFSALEKPPLSPPGWLFPVVWTILYVLMGVASYFVLKSDSEWSEVKPAIAVYALQLVFNFFWSIWFFNLGLYWFSFIWLVALWVLILLTIIKFFGISRPAAYLLLPYLLWVTFAGYLNFGIAVLN